MAWIFTGGNGAANTYQLPFMRSRKITFRRRGPATVTWKMDGRDSRTESVTEMVHDLKGYRDKELLFRGRIGPSNDDIGGRHNVNMAALDYRGRMQHRLIKSSYTLGYLGVEPVSQINSLLATLQAETNGNEGISAGTQDTVAARDFTWRLGMSFTQAVDVIAEADDGFDWEIDANMNLNTYAPSRGSTKTEPLDFGGAIASVKRQLKGNAFGNFVLGMGQGFLSPEEIAASDIATDSRGRWEITRSWPDVATQAVNDGRTQYLLDEVNTRQYHYKIKLRQGWWTGKDKLWLGDVFPVRVKSGRLDIDTTLKVENIVISLDSSGVETVEVEMQ